MPLSALIITKNEEHNIASVIENLNIADEIIVVDSFSTDKTIAIASSYNNVKIVQHHFENYATQRNFAVSLAKNSWILFLDADERLTPELKKGNTKNNSIKRGVIGLLFLPNFYV